MKEFLAFSDLHAHNFTYGAKRVPIKGLPGLYNSRLASTIDALREMLNYAKSNNIDLVLFGGDLFHTRKSIQTDVLFAVYHALLEFSQENIKMVLLVGNHDMGDREGAVHSLSQFRSIPNLVVADSVRALKYGKTTVITVPYAEEKTQVVQMMSEAAKLSDGKAVLLAHSGIQGAMVGSDYVLVDKSDLSLEDFETTKFSLCLFGHFHLHQPLFPGGYYIGSLTQHNWGDAGITKGFLHVKNGKVKQVEIQSAPRFWVVKDGDFSMVRSCDFVRSTMETSVEAATVEVVLPSEASSVDVELSIEELTPARAVTAWAIAHEKAHLTHLGLQILEKVSNE